MSRVNRIKQKGRREAGSFLALPHDVITCPNWADLNAQGVKLFIDVAGQIRFRKGGETTNGDLCMAWSVMQPLGWKSRDTLNRARQQLLRLGFVEVTQHGGRKVPTLYAVTWLAVAAFPKKPWITPTRVPSGLWRKPPQDQPVRKNPKHDMRATFDTIGGSNDQKVTSIDTVGVSNSAVSDGSLARISCTSIDLPCVHGEAVQSYDLVVTDGCARKVQLLGKGDSLPSVWAINLPTPKVVSAGRVEA